MSEVSLSKRAGILSTPQDLLALTRLRGFGTSLVSHVTWLSTASIFGSGKSVCIGARAGIPVLCLQN